MFLIFMGNLLKHFRSLYIIGVGDINIEKFIEKIWIFISPTEGI